MQSIAIEPRHAGDALAGVRAKLRAIPPPAPECELSIIVPVRDESEMLPATLEALARQADLAGAPLHPARYEMLILANNCRDASVAIARSYAHRYPNLAVHVVEADLPEPDAHVGQARRLLMDAAAARLLSLGRRRGVIASTDGDTLVAPTWVAATLHEIDQGADAVGGRILFDRAGLASLDAGVRDCYLRDVGYRWLRAELETFLDPVAHNPWPRHFQNFGASMAVTADAYRRAGGLPAEPFLEDVALFKVLNRIDARVRHSPAVRAVTSARKTGRTEFGLAVQLDRWALMERSHRPILVEPVPVITARLLARRTLREWWWHLHGGPRPAVSLPALAGRLGITEGWLIREFEHPQTFGRLLERVRERQGQPGGRGTPRSTVEIPRAIADLRATLAPLRGSFRTGRHPLEHVEAIEICPVPV